MIPTVSQEGVNEPCDGCVNQLSLIVGIQIVPEQLIHKVVDDHLHTSFPYRSKLMTKSILVQWI
jgi:hypothetical protein